MTPGELNTLLANLAEALRKIGIPLSREIQPQVVVNTRAKRRLGCCIRKNGVFTIEVSNGILEDTSLLRATLVHELLHTCYGCQNHKKRWHRYADMMNRAYGYTISRTESLPVE